MEKALKFLKDYRKSIPDHETYNAELDEAIKELEEAQLNRREWYQKGYSEAMNKTCHGCYLWNDFYAKCNDNDNSLAGVNGYCCNRYEAKDTQC